MMTSQDRLYLTEIGKEILLDIAFDSKLIKEKLSFEEHLDLCKEVINLDYQDILGLITTEVFDTAQKKLRLSVSKSKFTLNLFNKFADVCSKKCARFPLLSPQAKLCRMKCRIHAATSILKKVRSDYARCKQLSSSTQKRKCTERLRKEQSKWERRLEDYKIQIRQADVSVARERLLKKKAKKVSDNLQLSNVEILGILIEDSRIRDSLSFRDHLNFFRLFERAAAVEPPKLNPKLEKWGRAILYLGLWAIPVPFFNDAVNFLVKKHSFTCFAKCMTQKKISRSLCYAQCRYFSAKWATKYLESSLKKCNKHKKPLKCKSSLLKLLRDWKNRELSRKYKYEKLLRKETEKKMKRGY